jgi:uncharacterized glyoxalase superfamily protein PhnB
MGARAPAPAPNFGKDYRYRMPIHETFWATRFGMVADRFGTPWMINSAKVA